jgi:hypothetical protein
VADLERADGPRALGRAALGAELHALPARHLDRPCTRQTPGAKVVAASLATFNRYTSWDAARDLYRAGARPYFDVVSVHPFTNGAIRSARASDRVVKTVELVRREMRRQRRRRQAGDHHRALLAGGAGPGAARPPPRAWRPRQRPGGAAARGLHATRPGAPALGLRQVYWFNWASEYDPNSPAADVTFRFSG